MFKAMTDSTICKALQGVLSRIAASAKSRPQEFQHIEPRLVAVSKTKPVSMVKEAYACGQRHFGENYVQELAEKGKDPEILTRCQDIKWHFIGHLQRKNVNKVLSVPNIWMVETIDTTKVATAVNNSWERQATGEKLRVMVQVNTSQEPQKSGCMPEEVSDLVSHVLNNCQHLEFTGLMTIGAFDHVLENGPNPDFQTLTVCKQRICSELELDPQKVELSMGMSNDFEHAINVGSYNVRVGSTIFGAREVKSKDTNVTTNSVPSTSPEATKSVDQTNNDKTAKSTEDINRAAVRCTHIADNTEQLAEDVKHLNVQHS